MYFLKRHSAHLILFFIHIKFQSSSKIYMEINKSIIQLQKIIQTHRKGLCQWGTGPWLSGFRTSVIQTYTSLMDYSFSSFVVVLLFCDPSRGQAHRNLLWSSCGACPGPGLAQPTIARLGLGSAWAASRCLWSGSLEPLGAGKGCGRPGGAPSKAIYEGPHPHGHYGGGCSGLLPRPPAFHF